MNRPCASAWRQQCLPGAPPAEEDSREAQTLEKKRPLEEEEQEIGRGRCKKERKFAEEVETQEELPRTRTETWTQFWGK